MILEKSVPEDVMAIDRRAVSVSQAARLLGFTLKYVYDLLHSGRLKAKKKSGRWKIPISEISARRNAREE